MKTCQNFFKNSLIAIFSLCFVLIAPCVFAYEAISPLPSLVNDSQVEFEGKILQKTGDEYSIAVRYPQITTDAIAQADREDVNTVIRNFVDELSKQEIQLFIEEGIDPELDDFDRNLKNEMDVKFEIIRMDERFVSVKFDYYFYRAGAMHGMTMTSVLNYDIEKRRTLALKDLFEENSYYLEQISAKAIEDLKYQLLSRDDDAEASAEIVRWIEDGASPTEDNLFNFSWNGNFLTIYFQPYQVACGAAGAREVSMWPDDLSGFKTEFRPVLLIAVPQDY